MPSWLPFPLNLTARLSRPNLVSPLVRRLLPIVIVAALWAVPVSEAAVRHVVRGAGFGHGVGLSQYGAKGLAENGRSYREILTYYYQGTQVTSAPEASRTIRVLLQSGRDSIRFSGATRAPGEQLSANRTYTATRRGFNQVELRTAGGRLVGRFDSPLRVSNPGGLVGLRGNTINGIRDGQFRGALEIRPDVFGGMGAINALPLDDYVKGVVPGEVPAAWHEEALKAQAVAARSYAIATNRGGGVFDQYPDTRSQVYRGYGGEDPRTNAAVDATSDEVVTYNGAVITTFYFSTSGGRTENIENVFYGATPRPYYTSVEDPYDDQSPRHRWRFSFTTSQMQAKLRGIVKGRFRRIRVVRRGVSPRVVWADVYGSRGRTRVRGATLRTRLGLYDTWATFTRVTSNGRRSIASSSLVRRLLPLPPREIAGSIDPAPRSRKIVVERRTRRGWRAVERGGTTRRGAYRVFLENRGVYRVRSGDVVGPAVRVR